MKGVDVSNDAPGVVSRIHFESGALVQEGQVLVELDAKVERAQLASARARQELAEVSAKRSRTLAESRSIAQSQLDGDESTLKGAAADVSQLEAQIARKVVRAPFAGRLGIRQVNLGQYLPAGTTLTVLEATDSVYVDFTLPQQRLPDLRVGTPVRVRIEGSESEVAGAVSAVDPSIDAATRSIRARASVPNKDEHLRPGMFVNVTVVLPQTGSVVAVPAMAVVHASYGDSVFVVEDARDAEGTPPGEPAAPRSKVARQQFVRLGETRGDFVAVVDGVKEGEEVVTAGAFKLRNGARVTIKNDVKLTPELLPRPENR
ncbi:MAG: efflux RND transporter periplasmic adaptor subunit [Myxococcales bacterium]|nr:efflux RND transporter periplasmic adaptor subunit [Myxococcales bacterium]